MGKLRVEERNRIADQEEVVVNRNLTGMMPLPSCTNPTRFERLQRAIYHNRKLNSEQSYAKS
jgi:hypothetical protein